MKSSTYHLMNAAVSLAAAVQAADADRNRLIFQVANGKASALELSRCAERYGAIHHAMESLRPLIPTDGEDDAA